MAHDRVPQWSLFWWLQPWSRLLFLTSDNNSCLTRLLPLVTSWLLLHQPYQADPATKVAVARGTSKLSNHGSSGSFLDLILLCFIYPSIICCFVQLSLVLLHYSPKLLTAIESDGWECGIWNQTAWAWILVLPLDFGQGAQLLYASLFRSVKCG